MKRHGTPRPARKPRSSPTGIWLYEQRMQHQLRQSDLAAQLGISSGRISEWEQGVRLVPDEILADLTSLFSNG